MIVITTPTGQIGSQVLDSIIDSGETIRVIARDPARLSPDVRDRVEVIQGAHDDSRVVTAAFAGADAVFWLVPPDPQADSVVDYYLDFTRPACEAVRSQGVRRMVAVSSLGRDWAGARNAGQLSAAFAMDDLIEGTGVTYRALRPPFLMENLLGQAEAIGSQGMFSLANAGDRPLATSATHDVAVEAAKLLLDESWDGQGSVPVIGPDDLSPNAMAQVMSEVLGRPVRFQPVPGDVFKTTMMRYGMSEASAQGLVDMAAAQSDGIYDAEQRASPAAPTSFRQWCTDVLKPAVLA